MADRIVVFGATGYTGGLIASRLVAAGERPVLAGRSAESLSALAERLGGLEWARADAMRQNTVFDLVFGPGDMLVSTVGPFAKWGVPALRAAVAAGCRYLDSTGEPAHIQRVFSEFGGPALRSGAALLPAMGYDFAPGSLAGALALRDAPDAVRVDVAYYALGGGVSSLSSGTRESLVGITLGDGYAFRDGSVRRARIAERVRSFTVAGKSREAFSIGGAEHYALPAAFDRLREVNVYLGWFGPLSRGLQAGSLVGDVVTRVPGSKTAMRFVGERVLGVLDGPAEGETPGTRSWIAAEAFDGNGRQLSEVHLAGADGYDFTASFMAWAARQNIEASGALGPV